MDVHNKMNSLGTWLRELREARNLTLSEVAAATGPMDQSTLGKIERGDKVPTAAQASKLAAFFEVPVAEIESRRIEETIRRKYGQSAAGQEAILRIAEDTPRYGKKADG